MSTSSDRSGFRLLPLLVLAGPLLAVQSLAHAQTTALPEVIIEPNEPNDVRANDMSFGAGVAATGGTVIFGAPETDGHGAAYVFTQSGGKWKQVQKLLAPDIAEGAFGAHVVMDPSAALIADPDRQRVYSFQLLNGSWRATAILKASAAVPGYGKAMAMEGCVAMITSSGYVHVHNRCPQNPGDIVNWKYIRSVTPPGLSSDAQFGASVAFHGTEMLVGAPNENGGKGAVYYYTYHGNNVWTLTQRIVESGARADIGFGSVVAFHDDLAVIGLPFARGDQDNLRNGLALTFKRTGQTWTQTGELMPGADQNMWGGYGSSIVVTADRALIAAPYQYNAQVDLPGQVAIYKRVGATLQLEQWLYGQSLTGFGAEMVVSGRGLFVGDPGYEVPGPPGNRAGIGYVYQLPP